MTVSSRDTHSGPFAANGTVTDFPFTFEVSTASEVKAELDGVAISTSLYTVDLNDDGTGVARFLTAPVGSLFLFSDPAFQQPTKLENQGPYLQRTLEDALDREAIKSIYLLGVARRAIVAPLGEVGLTLPRAEDRVGKFLSFDANGKPFTSGGTGADEGLRGDLLSNGGSLVRNTLPYANAKPKTLDLLFESASMVSALNWLTDAEVADVTGYVGALDVTANLQAALDEAWAANRDLFIPAGLYTVTGLVMPGEANQRTRAFRVHGQGGGELFARGFDNGTIIQSSTDAPILFADQTDNNPLAGNGNQEVAYIRFEQTNPAATMAVVLFETLYAQSEIHHCGIYQAGVGDGLRIQHANTISIHSIYVMNRDWTGGSSTGIGVHLTCPNDNGLQTLYKITSRGFATAYKIGSTLPGESGRLQGFRMELCECSVNVRGIWLTASSQGGAVDNCYFEGGEGDYGIKNEGNWNTISNCFMGGGYAVGIDETSTANQGSTITGNSISLGSFATAADNPVAIAVHSNGQAKTLFGNSIIANLDSVPANPADGTTSIPNAKGIVWTGADPLISEHGTSFDPAGPWANKVNAPGAKEIEDNTTGTWRGVRTASVKDKKFPSLSGGLNLRYTDLGASDISATTLTLPKGGSFFAVSPSAPVAINQISAPHENGKVVAIRAQSSNFSLVNSATIRLRGQRTFNTQYAIIWLIGVDFSNTRYWFEIGRSSENSADKGAAVANAAGASPTKAEFDALLTSLRNANIIAT